MVAPAEKIVWGRPADMPEIEILAAENSRRPWCVYHQTYTVCTIMEHGGLTEWTYRRKNHVFYKHHVGLMEPGEVHRTTKHTGSANFYVVQISPELVGTLAKEVGVDSPPHLCAGQASLPGLFQAFARFHGGLANQASLLERQSRLTECINLLLLNCSERRPVHIPVAVGAALRGSRDYLHAHAAKHISLADLARVAGLSRFHFLRSFAQQFGVPPHAYQINLRIEKIRNLLKLGVPIQAIEAGFADQSHLIRHFKKSMKVTPGQYAAMVTQQ
ncbi:MAG: transcriptional regulator, AraC family [Verrucomicrobia bacterium]|nr:transcriptional regulator, AraC family [Verrucomicrobiota bacterium]